MRSVRRTHTRALLLRVGAGALARVDYRRFTGAPPTENRLGVLDENQVNIRE
jgi:hypothetical protein